MTDKHMKRCSLYLPTHTHAHTEVAKSGRCHLEKFGEEKLPLVLLMEKCPDKRCWAVVSALVQDPPGEPGVSSPPTSQGERGGNPGCSDGVVLCPTLTCFLTASWTVGAPGNTGASRTPGWGACGGGDKRPRGPRPQPLSSAHLWCAQLRL